MPWPRPAMWVNTDPHEHHDTSQSKKHLQVSLGHLVRRGMRCLGRTAEASAGVSCGWPFLPCQKPRVLSLSKPDVEVTHGYTAKYRQTHVLLLCAPSQPAVPGLWPRSCAASGGAPSWLTPPAPGSRSVYLHQSTQPASMQKLNSIKKNGVCSFAQVNRLNSRPKQDRSF